MATIEVSSKTLEEWAQVLENVQDKLPPDLGHAVEAIRSSVKTLMASPVHNEGELSNERTENPSNMEAMKQWEGLLAAIQNSATAPMAERVGSLVATLGELATIIAVPETKELLQEALQQEDALKGLVRQLGLWHQDGTWDALTQWMALLTAIQSSATGPMAERMGTLLADMGPWVSRVTNDDTVKTFTYFLDHQQALILALSQLVTWQSDGTWDSLMDIVNLIKAFKESVSPGTIERISAFVQEAGRSLLRLMESDMMPLALAVMDVTAESWQQAHDDPKHLTLGGMLHRMKDPNVQISLKMIFNILQKFPVRYSGMGN